MSQSALIVRVPESESLVGGLREKYDESSRVGMPAHITVLYPFMCPSLLTDDQLKELGKTMEQFSSFEFTLSRVGRFPETAYLVPEPAERFINITNAIYKRFPDYPPFGGMHDSIIPHLTVANADAKNALKAEEKLNRVLEKMDAINASCDSIELFGNESGRWKSIHLFPLPA